MKNYTYDSANRLGQVSDQSTVTSLSYNGLGQHFDTASPVSDRRLSMDAAGVTAHYVMDGDRPLTAESNGNTTFYLYGLGAIGEKTTAWNYSLPDGTNTPRQLSDGSGEITLSARYTPWGDTLDTFGTGGFTFGYLGGLLDASTGLLYVGNGQYYDPSTGRFLTRDVYPDSTNPYVPWNPIGAIVGPLGLIALVFGRRKKRSKVGTFLVLVLALGSVGMTLAACGSAPTPPAGSDNTAPPIMPVQTQTPVPVVPETNDSAPTNTPTPPVILTYPDCPTAVLIQYIEPWKRYFDYDPGSNSIPGAKWGGLDSNAWDVDRSELVWGWLGEALGKWWSGQYPNAKELTTWLLWQESGEMFSEVPGDNVYKDGGGIEGAKLMIQFMNGLFSDGIEALDLARFTAFFNPNSGGAFDQGDWNELMTPPPYYPYGNTVDTFWNLGPLNKELTWWVPGEPGFGYTPNHVVRHPNGSGDILYFAYK